MNFFFQFRKFEINGISFVRVYDFFYLETVLDIEFEFGILNSEFTLTKIQMISKTSEKQSIFLLIFKKPK